MRLLPLAAIVTGLAATPALAHERCDIDRGPPGLKIEFHASFGTGINDPQTDEQLHQMELKRRHGIVARSVRLMGDGCLEAFVQGPDGTWHNEYYDPDDYRRVD